MYVVQADGKVGPPPPPTLADASAGISNRMTAIDEKISSLDKELLRYKDQLKKTSGPAKANIQKRALETLKRKKMYEQQRDMIAGQQFNVDQTSFAMESIKDTQTVVSAMKTASVQLRSEQKKVDLGEIEDMQDDLYDMMEDMNEINEILGRSYGTPEGLDEDDLDAELAGLEEELESAELMESESSVPSYLQQSTAMPAQSAQPVYPTAPITNASPHLPIPRIETATASRVT